MRSNDASIVRYAHSSTMAREFPFTTAAAFPTRGAGKSRPHANTMPAQPLESNSLSIADSSAISSSTWIMIGMTRV